MFLNFLGVPVADMSFRGPYGVYHSIYDNHNWVARIGDPGFRYHAALVQHLGVDARCASPMPTSCRSTTRPTGGESKSS